MTLEQREMQAELRGQPQAEAAGAARVAQAGFGCRVQHQLMLVAAGAACDKRLLEQRETQAELRGQPQAEAAGAARAAQAGFGCRVQ